MGRSAFATDKSLLELTEEVKVMKSVIQTMSLELVKGSVPAKKKFKMLTFFQKGLTNLHKIKSIFLKNQQKINKNVFKSLHFQAGGGGQGQFGKSLLFPMYSPMDVGTSEAEIENQNQKGKTETTNNNNDSEGENFPKLRMILK